MVTQLIQSQVVARTVSLMKHSKDELVANVRMIAPNFIVEKSTTKQMMVAAILAQSGNLIVQPKSFDWTGIGGVH